MWWIFPFVFVVAFVAIIYSLSLMGWKSLAVAYAYHASFEGKRVGVISAKVGIVNYNNALILYYNDQGIYLKGFLIFKIFHTAIFIPYTEIVQCHQNKSILGFKTVEMVIGSPENGRIVLSQRHFDRFSQYYKP